MDLYLTYKQKSREDRQNNQKDEETIMEQILTVVSEYKRARRERNAASARQDFEMERMYNEELTDWAERLNRVMAAENVSIETVKALLNA